MEDKDKKKEAIKSNIIQMIYSLPIEKQQELLNHLMENGFLKYEK